MRNFSRFACVDWSGARGEFLPGIAVAEAALDEPPVLIRPHQRWSRQDVLDWLLQLAAQQADILIGLDLSFGFPFADCGTYFPQWKESPENGRELWAMVDQICMTDPHFQAESFLSHPQGRRHFRHGKNDVGDLFGGGIGRLRIVETHQRATKQANSWSCFNLVGAGQVGKSSLTGMRILHRLRGRVPIWPFDPVPQSGPLLVEIYTSMAARAAGMPGGRSKIRDLQSLELALAAFGSPIPQGLPRVDDHACDAILTASWLRHVHTDAALWRPLLLDNKIAQTEGWTFGVI